MEVIVTHFFGFMHDYSNYNIMSKILASKLKNHCSSILNSTLLLTNVPNHLLRYKTNFK